MIFNNIKELCKKRKITIVELEQKAGFSRGTIFKWKTSSPTVSNLKIVADILKVKVDALLKE